MIGNIITLTEYVWQGDFNSVSQLLRAPQKYISSNPTCFAVFSCISNLTQANVSLVCKPVQACGVMKT